MAATEEGEVSKSGVDQKSSRDLDRVTDMEADSELDTTKAEQALSQLQENQTAAAEARAARERELAKVVLKPEDVDLVASELEMDKSLAERALRENGGDVVKTLRALIQ